MVTRLQVKVKTFFKEMRNMTENVPQNHTHLGPSGHDQNRRGPLVALIGVLVSIEALMVTTGALYFLNNILLETPENLSGAIVVFAITVVIAIGLVATAIAAFRAQTWTRGAIVTWQILQFAVGTSFIQGLQIWQVIGWGMIFLSLFALIATFRANAMNSHN